MCYFLVGSLPADTAEVALRAGADLFADLVFALPDGETGPRRAFRAMPMEEKGSDGSDPFFALKLCGS
jgi:hypothetical protein